MIAQCRALLWPMAVSSLCACAAVAPAPGTARDRVESALAIPAQVGSQPAIVVRALGPDGAQTLVGDTGNGPVTLPSSPWSAEVWCTRDEGAVALEILAAARPQALVLRVDATTTGFPPAVPTRAPAQLIESLAKLPLEELDLEGPWEVGQRDLAALAAMTSLRRLRLGVSHLLPGALAPLAALPTFRELDLEPTRRVHPEAWADLAELTRLESLSAAGVPAWISFADPTPKVSDTELGLIVASAPRLRELNLSHSPGALSEAGLAHLAGLRHLETLRMDDCGELTAGGLRALRDMPLRELSIAGSFERATQVDRDGLEEVGNLSQLRVLRLGSSGEAGWDWLARLGVLKELDLGHLELTNEGVATLERLPRLEGLAARLSAEQLDSQALLRLAELPALRRLELDEGWSPEDAPALDDAFLERLAASRSLESLNLFELCGRYGDAGVASLARCPDLHVLRLHAGSLGSAGFKALAGLPRLHTLWLRGRFQDEALAPLRAAPALRSAWLEGPRLTHDGVQRALSGLPLTSLQVFESGDEGCDRCAR